jgi:hypothetical protein
MLPMDKSPQFEIGRNPNSHGNRTLSEEAVSALYRYFVEGRTIRDASLLAGHDRKTVGRYWKKWRENPKIRNEYRRLAEKEIENRTEKLESKADRSEEVCDEAGFAEWLQTAKQKDKITYHIGALATDRQGVPGRKVPEDRREIGRIADCALSLAAKGCLLLVQEPRGDGAFAYIAIMAKKRVKAA